MRRILVATDFSARSDRAIRRATLLARSYRSSITVVHVVDDDQPKRIVKAEQEVASALLSEQARSLREIDGVNCDYSVVLGNAFEAITKAVDETNCDLVVIGPHRRQALKDVFVGTTAERTIRASSRPILMANGVPAGSYRHVLVAVDFSDCSADAVRAVIDLGLEKTAAVSVVHIFDAPGTSLIVRGSTSEEELKDYLAKEEEQASRELAMFLANLNLDGVRRIATSNDTTTAHGVCNAAAKASADLVVVGTHGRTGIASFLLGSVAHEILRISDQDILAVPPKTISSAPKGQSANTI